MRPQGHSNSVSNGKLELGVTLQQLAYHRYRTDNHNSKLRKNVNFLLCHTSQEVRQPLKDWLINRGQPWEQILRPTKTDTDDPECRNIVNKPKEDIGVVLVGGDVPVGTIKLLGNYLISHSSLVCWQLEFPPTTLPVPVRQIFDYGIALTISEACFVEEPYDTLAILERFRDQCVRGVHPTSRFITPPDIRQIVLDQAEISTQPIIKNVFTKLAKILDFFDGASCRSFDDSDNEGDALFSLKQQSSLTFAAIRLR